MDVLSHVIYQIRNARLREWPFPHCLIDEILPAAFYEEMLANMPPDHAYDLREFGGKQSAERFRAIIRIRPDLPTPSEWWRDNMEWFTDRAIGHAMLARFGIEPPAESGVLSLVLHDNPGYALGPHTDIDAKLSTLVIYTPWRVPEIRETRSLGTSIYRPRCSGCTPAPGALRRSGAPTGS